MLGHLAHSRSQRAGGEGGVQGTGGGSSIEQVEVRENLEGEWPRQPHTAGLTLSLPSDFI